MNIFIILFVLLLAAKLIGLGIGTITWLLVVLPLIIWLMTIIVLLLIKVYQQSKTK